MMKNKEYVFTIKGKPVSDVRPRVSGRRIYDPRSSEKKKIKEKLKKVVSETDYKMPPKWDTSYNNRKKNIHDVKYLEVEVHTYIQCPKNFSKYIKDLAYKKIVRPGGRPDIDNYLKLYLDIAHDILYDDDSVIVNVIGKKYYAEKEDEHTDIVVRFIDIPEE